LKQAIFLILLLLLTACRSAAPPIKIKRLSAINEQPVGAKVEFTGWINSVAGNSDLGFELNVTETAGTFPRAMIDLKEGQTDPGINRVVCVRAEIVYREDVNGSYLYRLKQGEVIECY
jgi:hypothetical protein